MEDVRIPLPRALVRKLERRILAVDVYNRPRRPGQIDLSLGLHRGMTFEVYLREHPPPHFHVRYGFENASYSIESGARLPGVTGLERFDREVHSWWLKNRRMVALTWNKSRPADCPVGPVAVPHIEEEVLRKPRRRKRRKVLRKSKPVS